MAQSKGTRATSSFRVQEKRQLPSYSFQGVEYSFFEPVPDELLCPICREVLNEPLQTTCGHLFCKKCLNQANRSGGGLAGRVSASCPTCRTSYKHNGFADKHTERKVNNLQVKCCNFPCEWRGTIGHLQEHKLGACQYEPVNCPSNCGKRVIRKDLKKHKQNTCPLREVACEYCQWKGLYTKLGDHYTNCQSYPLPCPSCGAVDIPLHSVEAHLQECPEKKIKCPLSDWGCSAMMKSHSVEDHFENSKDDHLVLTMKRVNELSHAVVELTKIVRESRKRTYGQDDTISLLPFTPRPWLENPKLFPSMPWIIRMQGFGRLKTPRGTKWTSEPFFTKPTGYKLQLSVTVAGERVENADYLSVDVDLMNGPHDDRLPWLFCDRIKLILLNQLENQCHYETSRSETQDHASQRVPKGKKHVVLLRKALFISHKDIARQQNGMYKCQYLLNDCLFFKMVFSAII